MGTLEGLAGLALLGLLASIDLFACEAQVPLGVARNAMTIRRAPTEQIARSEIKRLRPVKAKNRSSSVGASRFEFGFISPVRFEVPVLLEPRLSLTCCDGLAGACDPFDFTLSA